MQYEAIQDFKKQKCHEVLCFKRLFCNSVKDVIKGGGRTDKN